MSGNSSSEGADPGSALLFVPPFHQQGIHLYDSNISYAVEGKGHRKKIIVHQIDIVVKYLCNTSWASSARFILYTCSTKWFGWFVVMQCVSVLCCFQPANSDQNNILTRLKTD